MQRLFGPGALARLRVGGGRWGCMDHATPACCTLHRRGLVDVLHKRAEKATAFKLLKQNKLLVAVRNVRVLAQGNAGERVQRKSFRDRNSHMGALVDAEAR